MQDIIFTEDYNYNYFNLPIFFCRFTIFCRCLDAEMKDSKRQGVSLQTKKEEMEAVTDENEEKFWSAGLFGSETMVVRTFQNSLNLNSLSLKLNSLSST